jgi:hypothetical protein
MKITFLSWRPENDWFSGAEGALNPVISELPCEKLGGRADNRGVVRKMTVSPTSNLKKFELN